MVLHASLGGVKAPQQQQNYTTKDRRGETRKKKRKFGSERIFFIILFFTHASRHGHSATVAATVKARRELSDTEKRARIILDE